MKTHIKNIYDDLRMGYSIGPGVYKMLDFFLSLRVPALVGRQGVPYEMSNCKIMLSVCQKVGDMIELPGTIMVCEPLGYTSE